MDNKKLKIIAILAIMATYIGFGFVFTGIIGIMPAITYIGMILYTAGMFLNMFLAVWYDNDTLKGKTEDEN